MKKYIFIVFVSFCVMIGLEVRADLQDVTENNVRVAANHFSSKLVKRKLDKKGYGPLREKVGLLEAGESLQADGPVLFSGTIGQKKDSETENYWYAPVYKVRKNTQERIGPLFVSIVGCKMHREAVPRRGYIGYMWYVECSVESVL